MAQTRTIVAVDPATGARFTRRTARTYVAVVVTGDPARGESAVTAHAWAGRPELAAKQLARWGGQHYARLAPVVEDSWTEPPAAEPAVSAEPPARAQVEIDPYKQGRWQRTGIGPDPVAVAERRAARWAERNPEHSYRVVAVAPAAAEPVAPEPVVSAEPVVAPYDVARLGFATFNPETEGLSEDPAPEPTLSELRADAAAGRPVSLAALSRTLGRELGLATGGRLSPRAVPAQPWDPGTPAARERVALQGERVGILWPIAQALKGAGVALPLSWATDGPVMAGELTLQAALSRLPLGAIAQAAAALAALPPVTTAQDAALTLCDTGAVPGRPYL